MTMRDAPALHLAFVALHLLLGHLAASLVYRLRFGRSPRAYARRGADGPHTRVTRRIALASLIWSATMVAAALSDAWLATVFGRPLFAPPMLLGWCLGLVGLFGMLAAQFFMGAAFRIGVDQDDVPQIHDRGLHRWSRNPIYLSSYLYLAGVSLWAPSPATLAALVTLGLLMHRLVMLEEAFLRARCGEAHAAYCARVPRYL
jgi:protein-S-isoprenylcysteine O-methyltransferase Ste14